VMGSLLSALCFALHSWLDDGVASDGLAGACGAMDVRSTDRWTTRGQRVEALAFGPSKCFGMRNVYVIAFSIPLGLTHPSKSTGRGRDPATARRAVVRSKITAQLTRLPKFVITVHARHPSKE
jgi:hypothetical protein